MANVAGNLAEEFEEQPEGVSGESSKQVLDVLEKASNSDVEVAGLKVQKPREAYENLKAAFEIVERKFPGLKIDSDSVFFKKFPGNIVGEATDEGIMIDPVMLMHPAMRLANVIAHETAHAGDKVENEGLVDAYVRELGFTDESGLKATEKYAQAEENFYEFVSRVADGKPETQVVKDLYELYYSGRYEEIYKLYKEKYLNGLESDKEKNEAFTFFKSVFPELEVKEVGKFDVYELPSE